MEFKEIQELIRLVNKHNIAEISVEDQNFRVKIKNGSTLSSQPPVPSVIIPPVQTIPVLPQIQPPITTDKTTGQKTEETSERKHENAEQLATNHITIKSPIVGTFYRSAGPDKDVFVKPGDAIQVGTVLCIIEAMKLFNEIESEHAGRIVKILVDDATPVEYDQPLFLIEPR